MKLAIKCAWCGITMRNEEWDSVTMISQPVSHSICPSCLVGFSNDLDAPMESLNGQKKNS